MVTTGRLQHIRYQFRRDGGSRLVLFILARVGEIGKDGGDAASRSSFASIDHDQEFHETIVDIARGSGLQNEY